MDKDQNSNKIIGDEPKDTTIKDMIDILSVVGLGLTSGILFAESHKRGGSPYFFWPAVLCAFCSARYLWPQIKEFHKEIKEYREYRLKSKIAKYAKTIYDELQNQK